MFYILPSSKKQSNMKGSQQSMPHTGFFETKAQKLVRCFRVGEDLLPVFRRFKNAFWESLEYWVLPPAVQKRIKERSLVLSPLLGIALIDSPVPNYNFGWEDECEGVKLRDFWVQDIKNLTKKLLEDKVVMLFVGKKEASLLDLSTADKVITFEYYRANKKVKNPMPHRAYTLRYIAEKNLNISDLFKINFYDYTVESIQEKGRYINVLLKSEGRYI